MKISIITVTLNSELYLEEALRSVRNQHYEDLEHIVVDGGSTDGTLAIVERFREGLRYVVSEPDQGISDAFNKGIRACSGEVVGIVSADDALLPGALEAVAGLYETAGRPDIVHGNCLFVDPTSGEQFLSKPDVTLKTRFRGQPLKHGAVFVRREAYEKWGLFDLNYQCAMDYDLTLRLIVRGARLAYVDRPLARIRLGGVNNRRRAVALRESREISIRYGCPKWRASYYYYSKVVRDCTRRTAERAGLKGLVRLYRQNLGRARPIGRSPRLIAFSGMDGAGKSTQIELLEQVLTRDGRRVRRFWARGGYTPVFSAAKALVRSIRPTALPKPGQSSERSQRFQSPVVRHVWLWIAIVDLAIWYVAWQRWQRLCGRVLLCDRYLDDTLMDFRRNFPQEKVEQWWTWRTLERFTPRPDVAFMLLISVDESARRSKLKNEPFPDSEETLRWRLGEYERLATSGKWRRIDAGRAIREVHEEILDAVRR